MQACARKGAAGSTRDLHHHNDVGEGHCIKTLNTMKNNWPGYLSAESLTHVVYPYCPAILQSKNLLLNGVGH